MSRRQYFFIIVLIICISLVGSFTFTLLNNSETDIMPTIAVIDNQTASPIVANFNQPDLMQNLSTNDEFIFQYNDGITQTELEKVLSDLDGTILRDVPQINGAVVVFDNPVDEIQFSELSSAYVIEPNYVVQSLLSFPPNDPMTNQQWALKSLDIAPLWEVSSGAGITVAVIDSGVCFNHPDLQGRFRIDGVDFVDGDDDPTDMMGHGCAISGIIGANVNNTIGITGVAPNVDILPIRVLDENGSGTYADVIAAIYYAVDAGADILNLSLGGQNPSQLLEQAINYAIDNGVHIVAGTGNTGQNGVLYPAHYANVIAVGSHDLNGNRSSFSTYGNEVDTLAPGENILTTTFVGGYGYFSGTSMSAPHVSGLLALSKASGLAIDLTNLGSTPTPNAVVTDEFLVEALATPTASITPYNVAGTQTPTTIPTATLTAIPTSDPSTQTCTHNVAADDVNGLISTLESALLNAGDDVICLGGGTYSLTVTHNGDNPWNYNGLPIIDSTIIIKGNYSIIERDDSAPDFRIFEVADTGDFTLLDTIIQNGQTDGFGGGINSEGILLVVNSQFVSNTAYIGGGIHIEAGQSTILDSEFRYNVSENDINNQDSWGGGFHNKGYSIIDGTLFFENQSDRGAGLSNHSDLTITNSRFIGNTATKYGAAINGDTSGSNIVLADSCIYGNTSPSYTASVVSSDESVIQAYRNWWGNPIGLNPSEEQNLVEIDNLHVANLGCLGGDYQEFESYEGDIIDITLNDAVGGVPPYTYSNFSPPYAGTISGTYPSFTFTTGASKELLLYTITDASGYSVTGGVKISNYPILQAISATYTTEWDSPLNLTMTNNGGAPPFTFSNLSSPTGGVLTGTIPNFVYNVTGTYTDPEIITYNVTDKLGSTVTNTWIVNLTELTMSDNEAVTAFNTAVNLPLSINGGFPPYDVSVVDNLTLGNISGDYPNLIFTPNNNAVGTEVITLHATDQIGNIASAELTLTVCRDSITYHINDSDVQGLRNAIDDAQDGVCGFVPDVIELAQNGEYLFGDYVNTSRGRSALPFIYTNLVINGHGSMIERLDNAPDFRLLTVIADPETSISFNNFGIINGFAKDGSVYQHDFGGGMYLIGASSDVDDTRMITLDGILFESNEAENRGNALYLGGDNITIRNSAFIGNGKSSSPSTIYTYNHGGKILLENNIFYDNGNGGTVVYDDGATTLRHNTFWQNKAINIVASGSVTRLEGNLLGESSSQSCSGNNVLSFGYNISFDSKCSGDLTSQGDQLNTPSGISSLIYLDDDIIPILALSQQSPALDAIPIGDCNIATDISGNTRPLDSNGDGTSACNIGAVENGTTDFVLQKSANTSSVAIGDIVDFSISIANNGSNDATGVILTDVLPFNMLYESSIETQGSYNPINGQWLVGRLDAGDTETLTLQAKVYLPLSGTSTTNTAAFFGANLLDNNNDFSDSSDINIICPSNTIFNVADGDVAGLISAINTANNNICGTGTTTITLANDGLYVFDKPFNDFNALPTIEADITFEGNNATFMRNVSSTQNFRFIQISDLGDLTINNMSFEDGYLPEAVGSAILSQGNLSITNGMFTNNTAHFGGAIYHQDGAFTVNNSAFSTNTSTGNGSALYLHNADSLIENSHFEKNQNTSTGTVEGGAIYGENVNLNVQSSTFAKNSNVSSNYRDGGAIGIKNNDLVDLQVIINDSIFDDNSARRYGGAITLRDALTTITNSSFVNNSSNGKGGAVVEIGGELNIDNSIFASNYGYESGALYIEGYYTLNHVTIANNRTGRNVTAALSGIRGKVKNTVIANNIGGEGNCSYVDSQQSEGYNVSSDIKCYFNQPTDQANVTVAISDLGYFGLDKPVVLPESANLIDIIPLESCELTNDLYGHARPQGSGCDIGAIEVTGAEIYPPYGLYITQGELGGIWTMTWQDDSSADSYEIEHIYQSSSGTSNSEIITIDGSATSYLIDTNNLICDSFHNYRIRSYHSASNFYSDWSNLDFFYLPCELLPTPTNVSGVAISPTDIQLSWDPITILVPISSVSGTTEWIEQPLPVTIEQFNTDNSNWNIVAQYVYSNYTVLGGFECEMNYQFRVRVYDYPNYSNYSDIAHVDMNPCLLYAPADFVAEAGIRNDVILTWTDNNPYETNYIVERSLNSGWETLATLPADTITFTDATPLPNLTYTYRIRAYRSTIDQYSAYSSTVIETPPARQIGSEFTVTTLSDGSGICYVQTCTLRSAIETINLYQISGTIKFDLPGAAPHRIRLTDELPIVEYPVTIDGWSQPGWTQAPIVWIDGNEIASTIILEGGNSTVQGLVIADFYRHNYVNEYALILKGENNAVYGNYIGIDPTGTIVMSNRRGLEAHNAQIGGALPHQRNVISGNTLSGIGAENSVIQNNIVGLDPTGTFKIGSQQYGITGSNNLIGGTEPNQRNIVSGISFDGIAAGDGTVVYGNIVGTDITMSAAIPNGTGISGYRSIIGGDNPGEGNIVMGNIVGIQAYETEVIGNYVGIDDTGTIQISNNRGMESVTNVYGNQYIDSKNIFRNNVVVGNLYNGVQLSQGGNTLYGNYIGVTRDLTPIPNGSSGVHHNADSLYPNIIGGYEDGQPNIIAHNNGAGISSGIAKGAWIQRNVIFNNGGLAIDYMNDGVINRDSTDHIIDAPSIFDIRYDGSSIRVVGEFTVDESQVQPYVLDVYHNASCDPLGNGEAENYVGQAVINTTEQGYFGFDITLPYSGNISDVINVIVTNTLSQRSSEMSNCADIVQDTLPAPSNLVTTPIDDDSVQLDWIDNSNDESSFVLETSVNREIWFIEAMPSANVTQAIVDDLTCETTRYFRVRAVRSSDSAESANSAYASFTTPDCVIPIEEYLYVTTNSDTYDGVCDADCSLRDAITASNNASGTQIINVPTGTYQIITSAEEDEINQTGDFDITDDVYIIGAGVDSTIIDMNKLFKAFHVHGLVEFWLSDLTIINSSPDTIIIDGSGYVDFGAVRNDEGILHITDVNIRETKRNNGSNNYHIYNRGQAYLTRVELSQDVASNSGYDAIYNNGYMEINYAHIHDNYGVIKQEAGDITISNSLIVNNRADRNNGDIISLSPDAEELTIEFTTFSYNDTASIFRFYSTPVILRARNSIFDATRNRYFKVCENGSIVNIGANLYSDSSCGAIDLGLGDAVVVDSVLLDGNYRPNIGSQAIDAATGDCPTHDFYGTPRPIGSNCDIGAVESFYTPMDPPTNLTGTVVNNLNIDLVWQDNTIYETSYVVERSTNNVDWIEVATLPTGSESYSDTTLLNCFTDYYYRVSSRVDVLLAISSVIQLKTGCSPIIAPSNLIVTVIKGGVDLSWQDNSQTETGFNILRRVSGNDDWEIIQTLGQGSASYQDNTVICETPYEYQVEAYRNNDNDTAQSSLTDITSGICSVSAPISFTSTSSTELTINLAWVDTSDNETGFEIYQVAETSDLIATLPEDTQAYTVTGLSCNTTYNFQLQGYRIVDGERENADLAQLETATLRCAVKPPTNPIPMAVQRNSTEIMWQDASPEETTHFRIERAIEGNSGEIQAQALILNWNLIAQIPDTYNSFIDTNLVCGTTYWYRVQGYDQNFDEYSSYSDPIQIITSDCPVPVTNTIGLYQDGMWMFRDGFDHSASIVTFRYGPQESGWIPLTGDWDGDGIDGIGLYKNGVFALRDVSERGISDYVYRFGNIGSNAQPIVGDWDGDGQDTVGLYRNGLFVLTNSHETRNIDHQFVFGRRESGWTAIAGDWTATGRDLVGLYKDGVFQLHNTFTTQSSGQLFRFGPDTGDWTPITGDWDADGSTTIGLYKDSSWRFRNTNSRGQVDFGFTFGNVGSSAYPIASYRGGEEALEALAFVSAIPLPDMNLTLEGQVLNPVSQTITEPVFVTVTMTEATFTPTPTASISSSDIEVEPTFTPSEFQEMIESPTFTAEPTSTDITTQIPTTTPTFTAEPTSTDITTQMPTMTPTFTAEPTIGPTFTPSPTPLPTVTIMPTSVSTVTQVSPEITQEARTD